MMLLKAIIAIFALAFAFIAIAAGMVHQERETKKLPNAQTPLDVCMSLFFLVFICLVPLVVA